MLIPGLRLSLWSERIASSWRWDSAKRRRPSSGWRSSERAGLGTVVSAVQHAGLEVRHVENLREHYALTLRAWVRNLEQSYDDAVRLAGAGRARVWRLYLAGSALGFEGGTIEIHQTLSVESERGSSGMPWRPGWEQPQHRHG